jgi:hypothetical protein
MTLKDLAPEPHHSHQGAGGLPAVGGAIAMLAVTLAVALASRAEAAIYWPERGGGSADSIGRAKLDGSGVDRTLITGTIFDNPSGVAVDAAHIYWTNTAAGTTNPRQGTIGCANIDGTGVDQSSIIGLPRDTERRPQGDRGRPLRVGGRF